MKKKKGEYAVSARAKRKKAQIQATLTVRVASHPVNRRKESGLRGGVG